MAFKKSLLISGAVHILALIFIPGYHSGVEERDWVEVSLVTIPDTVERQPEWAPGEETNPQPAMEASEIEKRDLPVEEEEYFSGIPVTEARPEVTEEDIPEIDAISKDEKRPRRTPGRREREGPIPQEGEDEDFTLTGPVARRDVLRRVYPIYPQWAQEQGIEGTVKLRFWVTPQGMVRRVELENTSGYPEMDSRAIEAMKKWMFEPEDSQELQWGTINIRYSLK